MPALSLAGNMSLSIAELDESGRPEVICIGYEVSLERRKIYVSIADSRAEKLGQLRVIDESREGYQTLINDALAKHVSNAEQPVIAAQVRKILQEELAQVR